MRTSLIAFAALGLACMPGHSALAQGWEQSFSPGEARDAVRKGDIVPLRDIFQSLKKRYGGYQLDAELYSIGGGRSEYRIEWMSQDGRRMKIRVDAGNGRELSSRGG